MDRVRFLKSLLYINVHVHANKSICESFRCAEWLAYGIQSVPQ